LESNATSPCSSRVLKHVEHLLLLKMFGINFGQSATIIAPSSIAIIANTTKIPSCSRCLPHSASSSF
jgi:hypothetical protein